MSPVGNERAKLTGSLLRPGSFLLATLATLGLSLAACSSSSPSTSGTPTTSSSGAATPSTSATATAGTSAAALATAPVGANPQWDDLDPITDTIYVANGGTGAVTGNTVSVINGRTCRVGDLAGCAHSSPSVTVGRSPGALAVDPTTDTVYVTNGHNTVAVIDGATCNAEVVSGCRQRPPEVTVGRVPSSVAIDPVNHTAYVTNAAGNDVSMINTLRCRSSNLVGCSALRPPTVAVGVGPADVAVDELTHTVYVTNDDEMGPNDGTTMSVFDASTCNATTQIGCSHQGLVKVGTGPLALAVDQSTNTIFTANHSVDLPSGAPSSEGTVSVIDGLSCDAADLSGCRAQTPGTVPVGWGPDEAALDGPAHTLYIANVHGENDTFGADGQLIGSVSVIDTDACTGAHLAACRRAVVATVQTGVWPAGVAVDPLTHTLYVPNDGDNDVSVIDAAECDATDTTGCQAPST
jgi:DNA-binding beta-propeller fold protein YncE